MGWGLGDEERRDTAKLQLAQLRIAKYKPFEALRDTLRSLSHDEKRRELCKQMTTIDAAFDEIERQLHR